MKATALKKYYGKGKFTAVIGTSGSGKSTLLHMLGGLDTPSEGSVLIGDTDLAGLTGEQATIFCRKQVGFVFQNYNLVPILGVWENIILPISLDGRKPDGQPGKAEYCGKASGRIKKYGESGNRKSAYAGFSFVRKLRPGWNMGRIR